MPRHLHFRCLPLNFPEKQTTVHSFSSMAIELQYHSLISSSSLIPRDSGKPTRTNVSRRKVAYLGELLSNWRNPRRRHFVRLAMLDSGSHSLSYGFVGLNKNCSALRRSGRIQHLIPFATSDDGKTINGNPSAGRKRGVKEKRVKLNQSVQSDDYSNGLVQSLHEAARIFELAIKEHSSFSRKPWFSAGWLGADQNAWVKTLSYQASVYSLLQAASEISSRGDSRDRDTHVCVQRSLFRQSAPLENAIRESLTGKQPEVSEWFWSEQVPLVVTTYVNNFEGDSNFAAATAFCGKGMSSDSAKANDISLLMLALTCIAAITKLGPAKVSCPQFFSITPDTTGRLMDMLVDLVRISQAYHSIKDMGLHREFLVHFGPQAAACRVNSDQDAEEVVFWVDLVQNQLQRAIDREKIWSKLTTSESIEVLERDLAVFGFFIALGRSTQSLLSENGFDVLGDSLESFIRYLIGGSVLYYPQLSSISSYQFYVEVVCEELDWLPFYPGQLGTPKQSHGHKSKREGPPNAEAIILVLEVCSYWIQSFIKYSKWLENPSNVKAAKFLSTGHKKLMVCFEEVGSLKNEKENRNAKINLGRTVSGKYMSTEEESESFDKALEDVEEALLKLEELIQELHVSSSNSGKEDLKAACSDLEKIRKLKKEAEFMAASFRAKADSFQQGDSDSDSESSASDWQQYMTAKNAKSDYERVERSSRSASKSRNLWSFFGRLPTNKPQPESSVGDPEDENLEQPTANMMATDSGSNDIQRFELLRNELIELEKRVQRSTEQSNYDKDDITLTNDSATHGNNAGDAELIQVQKKENIMEKSIGKLKETSTDVLQGTQLLAIDVAASTELLRRVVLGDELTEKEQKSLRRTMTDLASVVPIGVLMLLPVTAVGHAAMLAAIQRYVPSLIPSTYGSERLDLFRKLEKMKELEMENVEKNSDEDVEKVA